MHFLINVIDIAVSNFGTLMYKPFSVAEELRMLPEDILKRLYRKTTKIERMNPALQSVQNKLNF